MSFVGFRKIYVVFLAGSITSNFNHGFEFSPKVRGKNQKRFKPPEWKKKHVENRHILIHPNNLFSWKNQKHTLPLIIVEVDTGALEDDFSFQWGHLPLLWLLENEYLKCIRNHTQPNNKQFFHCSCGKKRNSGSTWLCAQTFENAKNHWRTHHSMDATHYGIRRCFIGPDNCSCWKTWVIFMITSKGPHDCVPNTWNDKNDQAWWISVI